MFYGQSVECCLLDRCRIPFPSENYSEFRPVKYCREGQRWRCELDAAGAVIRFPSLVVKMKATCVERRGDQQLCPEENGGGSAFVVAADR